MVVVDYDDMENAAANLMAGDSPATFTAIVSLISSLGRSWDAAFITLGVGASSKVTPEELWRVDHHVPLAFSKAAKQVATLHIFLAGPRTKTFLIPLSRPFSVSASLPAVPPSPVCLCSPAPL